MRARYGLTLVAALGMLLLSAWSAESADPSTAVITVRSNYTKGGGYYPTTVKPGGRFTTDSYPNKDGGTFRVLVTFGKMENNEFKAFDKSSGYPAQYAVGNKEAPMGASDVSWGATGTLTLPAAQIANDMVRAELQRKADIASDWATVAKAYDYIE